MFLSPEFIKLGSVPTVSKSGCIPHWFWIRIQKLRFDSSNIQTPSQELVGYQEFIYGYSQESPLEECCCQVPITSCAAICSKDWKSQRIDSIYSSKL